MIIDFRYQNAKFRIDTMNNIPKLTLIANRHGLCDRQTDPNYRKALLLEIS